MVYALLPLALCGGEKVPARRMRGGFRTNAQVLDI